MLRCVCASVVRTALSLLLLLLFSSFLEAHRAVVIVISTQQRFINGHHRHVRSIRLGRAGHLERVGCSGRRRRQTAVVQRSRRAHRQATQLRRCTRSVISDPSNDCSCCERTFAACARWLRVDCSEWRWSGVGVGRRERSSGVDRRTGSAAAGNKWSAREKENARSGKCAGMDARGGSGEAGEKHDRADGGSRPMDRRPRAERRCSGSRSGFDFG